MLTPIQRKRLADLDAEWIRVCEERNRYTTDYTPKGIAEWDRLWARYIQIGKERNRILAEATDVPVVQEPIQA